MKSLKKYINEALISSKKKINVLESRCIAIDEAPAKSKERAEMVLDLFKQRYGEIFEKIEILRTNNVKLSDIETRGTVYDGSTFTIYLNFQDYFILRRTDRRGGTAKLLDDIKNFETIINRFDKLLIKKGYNVKV